MKKFTLLILMSVFLVFCATAFAADMGPRPIMQTTIAATSTPEMIAATFVTDKNEIGANMAITEQSGKANTMTQDYVQQAAETVPKYMAGNIGATTLITHYFGDPGTPAITMITARQSQGGAAYSAFI